jgi:hypothetical protein
MIATCETWSEAVNAVDAFERPVDILRRRTSISFGGVAYLRDDNTFDILSSRAIQQNVLNLLDEPPAR